MPEKSKKAKDQPLSDWTVATPGRPPYKVGYCRPPKEYRFKPGQSGNPAGRPTAAKRLAQLGLAALLAEALAARTTIRVAGRRRRGTKLEAMTKALADLAAVGDARAVKLLVDQLRKDEARRAAEPAIAEAFTAADREVIAALVMRIGRAA